MGLMDVMLLGCVIGGVVVVWSVVVLARLGSGFRMSLVRNEDANATIEFALVFPILLFLCLALTQTAMLMGAGPLVEYASFAGARSAIVQIPRDLGGEPSNYYVHAVGGAKHDAIHRAAAMSLLGICPDIQNKGDGSDGAMGLGDAVAKMYEGYGKVAPVWVEQLAGRSVYALMNTEVTVGREIGVGGGGVEYEVMDGGTFGAKDAIAVRVDHRYALTVPWANRLYADGAGSVGGGGGGGVSYWRMLSAQTRLTGAGVLEDLPERPVLGRYP